MDLVWELYCELSSTQLELQLGGKTSNRLLALCTIGVIAESKIECIYNQVRVPLFAIKIDLRSDKARSTKSMPPIQLLYALMA